MKTFTYLVTCIIFFLMTSFIDSHTVESFDYQEDTRLYSSDIELSMTHSHAHSAKFSMIPDVFYIALKKCGSIQTYCCCDDGNSHVCYTPGSKFVCYFGGPFECTLDLGDCGENPSNCHLCCPGSSCHA